MEAELEDEIEFEVVKNEGNDEENPEWENQIQEMLDAEDEKKWGARTILNKNKSYYKNIPTPSCAKKINLFLFLPFCIIFWMIEEC